MKSLKNEKFYQLRFKFLELNILIIIIGLLDQIEIVLKLRGIGSQHSIEAVEIHLETGTVGNCVSAALSIG